MNLKNLFYWIFLLLDLSVYNAVATVTQAEVSEVIQLTVDGKLPGRVSAYSDVTPDTLAGRVVDTLISSDGFRFLPEFMGGGTHSQRRNFVAVLPDAIQDQVKIKYWATTGIPLSSVPLGVLESNDAKLLMRNECIPNVPNDSMRTIKEFAKYLADHYASPGLLGGWSVADKYHKMSAWLKLLSVEIQNEVKKYYHCAKLKNKENVWLDDDKAINIPTSYFVEYDILPLPDGVSIDQLRELERYNRIDEEAGFYANLIKDLEKLKNEQAQLIALASKIKDFPLLDFRNKIVDQYAASTNFIGDLLNDKNLFGSIDWGISLEKLLQEDGLIDLINAEIERSKRLDLSKKRISSIKCDDFSRLNCDNVETLTLSGNNLKKLPADLFRRVHFPKLKNIIISNNLELKSLPLDFFAGLENNEIDLIDLSSNKLTEIGLPLFGGLNVKSVDFSRNCIKTLPSKLFKSKENATGQIVTDETCANSISEVNLSYNPISFECNVSIDGDLRKCLMSLNELRFLDLSSTQISELQDVLNIGLKNLEYLILANNSLIKTLVGINNTPMPRLHTLDLCNCSIERVDKTSFQSFRNLRRLNLTGNKLKSCGEQIATGDSADEGSAFSCLRKLEELYLGRNNISSLTEESFRGLYGLKILCLDGNSITKIPSRTFNTNTKLEELYLFANNSKLPVDSSSKKPVTTIKESVKTSVTKIEDNAFFGLSNLKYLDLSYNRIEKLGVKTFTDLNELTHLNLAFNLLSEITYPTVSILTNMQFFDISFNGIQKLDWFAVSALKSCKDVNMRGNSITLRSWSALLNKSTLSIGAGTKAKVDKELLIWSWIKSHKIFGHEIVRKWSDGIRPRSLGNVEDYYSNLKRSYKKAFFDKKDIMTCNAILDVTDVIFER